MPKLVTREERLERLIAKTRSRIDANPEATRSLSHSPDSSLGALVRQAGYERTSLKLLDALRQRFIDAGIETYPDITDPGNTLRTRIYFFDGKNKMPGYQHPRHLFAEEKELSRFLVLNKDVLKYCKKNNIEIRGPEVRIADNCRIDLLGIDRNSGDLVGFELKATAPDIGLVSQAAKYMKALRVQAEKEGRRGARLLIVTGQPDAAFEELVQDLARKYDVPTSWLLYHVTIDLIESK